MVLYVTYNTLLTFQLVADERSGYDVGRGTLRVTHPEGIQRSSYFISMPKRYGAPLMAANSVFHWLISCSFFLVSIDAFCPGGEIEDMEDSYYLCGHSNEAILARG